MDKWIYYKPKFDYLKYLDINDSAWKGHVNFAYDLVRNSKPKVIVELGTHRGHSFFSFVQAVKDAKFDTKLYAIDTWEGDKQAGFYGKDIHKEVKEIMDKEYRLQKISLLKGYFKDFVKDFSNDSIDILNIDGLHTYEAVKSDFESWFPKVKKNGIILLHDVVEKDKDFGVYRIWDEVIKKMKSFKFDHSHGLGVVFKGNILPALDEEALSLIIPYYSLDGLIEEKDGRIHHLESELKKLHDYAIDLKKDNDKLVAEISKDKTELERIRSSRAFKLYKRLKGGE